MVRIKYRYLLVNILYPEPQKANAISTSDKAAKASFDLLQVHSPSPDDLTPQLLVRLVKDQVTYLYGDYGHGLIAGSLNGLFPLRCPVIQCLIAH